MTRILIERVATAGVIRRLTHTQVPAQSIVLAEAFVSVAFAKTPLLKVLLVMWSGSIHLARVVVIAFLARDFGPLVLHVMQFTAVALLLEASKLTVLTLLVGVKILLITLRHDNVLNLEVRLLAMASALRRHVVARRPALLVCLLIPLINACVHMGPVTLRTVELDLAGRHNRCVSLVGIARRHRSTQDASMLMRVFRLWQLFLTPGAVVCCGLKAATQRGHSLGLPCRHRLLVASLLDPMLMIQQRLTEKRSLLIAVGFARKPLLDDVLRVVVVHRLHDGHLVVHFGARRTLAVFHVARKVQIVDAHGPHERWRRGLARQLIRSQLLFEHQGRIVN